MQWVRDYPLLVLGVLTNKFYLSDPSEGTVMVYFFLESAIVLKETV